MPIDFCLIDTRYLACSKPTTAKIVRYESRDESKEPVERLMRFAVRAREANTYFPTGSFEAFRGQIGHAFLWEGDHGLYFH